MTVDHKDFTDAIAEDWGGKPFVDLQKGWKYALDKYPEVGYLSSLFIEIITPMPRLMRIMPLLLVPVGADML